MDFKSLLGIFLFLLFLLTLWNFVRFFVICASFSNFTSNFKITASNYTTCTILVVYMSCLSF